METTLSFGISTTVLRERTVSYALERIARAGYHSAEVWHWHMAMWDEDAQVIKRRAGELGLRLTMHAPAEDLNPISLDAEIAAASRKSLEEALRIAVDLEAEVLAVHPGRLDEAGESFDEAWERMLDWIFELEQTASKLDLEIGLELMERLPLEIFMKPSDAARLMALPLERVGVTIDVAHMNTHMDPVDYLARIEPKWIKHVHLADNAPWRVHLPLGEGQIDIGAVLTKLAEIYRGIVSIEGSVPGKGEKLLERNMGVLSKLGWGKLT